MLIRPRALLSRPRSRSAERETGAEVTFNACEAERKATVLLGRNFCYTLHAGNLQATFAAIDSGSRGRRGGHFPLLTQCRPTSCRQPHWMRFSLLECSKRLLKPLAQGGPLVFHFEHSEAQGRALVATPMSRVN